MALYFLRHGESIANTKKLFAGQKDDSPLTKLGIEQARTAAIELEKMGIQRIITSKLLRAQQTAFEVATIIDFDPTKIEFDDRILEYDMGALTGTLLHNVTPQELAATHGAEDPGEFRERVLNFLREYKSSPQNILIVSHAGFGRAIEAARQNLNPAEFYRIPPSPNARAHKLELDWLGY